MELLASGAKLAKKSRLDKIARNLRARFWAVSDLGLSLIGPMAEFMVEVLVYDETMNFT